MKGDRPSLLFITLEQNNNGTAAFDFTGSRLPIWAASDARLRTPAGRTRQSQRGGRRKKTFRPLRKILIQCRYCFCSMLRKQSVSVLLLQQRLLWKTTVEADWLWNLIKQQGCPKNTKWTLPGWESNFPESNPEQSSCCARLPLF